MTPVKLNMGCGRNKMAGYVNVDAAAACEPDEVVDLEVLPWPWPDGCAEEIVFNHSLEHMGAAPAGFLAIMKEIYRIAAPGCRVVINVPHPRHDNFISDPTHVRAITPSTLHLFDRELNEDWAAKGFANTPLALYTGVDFKVVHQQTTVEEPYLSDYRAGKLTSEALQQMIRQNNNIASEYRFVLVARKPAGQPPA